MGGGMSRLVLTEDATTQTDAEQRCEAFCGSSADYDVGVRNRARLQLSTEGVEPLVNAWLDGARGRLASN